MTLQKFRKEASLQHNKIQINKLGVSPPWKTKSAYSEPLLSLSNSKLAKHIQNDPLDRYIPKQLNFNSFHIQNQNKPEMILQSNEINTTDSNLNETLRKKSNANTYKLLLKKNISQTDDNNKVLSYKKYHQRKSDFVLDYQTNRQMQEDSVRKIPKQPYKILDAPRLKDDFYNNLLDWSKDDLISIALGKIAYVWSGKNNQAEKITQGRISSMKWGKGLAIGQETGVVRIFDVQKKKQINKYHNHLARIGTIDFNHNIMATGSKDERIILTDVRCNTIISRFCGHKQQVCGVKWSFDDNFLASGGNDNSVIIWSSKMNKQIIKFDHHTAAVKGLAWSPHKHSLLVTGGGTTDKTIKLWSSHQLKLLNSIDTGSQVCNMVFSQNVNELITTHGYSLNTISVWRQKDMKKIATLHGHSYRVLYLALSPDGESIVTGSGDQTLRFWKVFPSRKQSMNFTNSNLDMCCYQIR